MKKPDGVVDLVKSYFTLAIISRMHTFLRIPLYRHKTRERLRRAKDDTKGIKGISLIMIYAHYTHPHNSSSCLTFDESFIEE